MRYLLVLILLVVSSPAWSATQLKKVVAPSGGDYTSLEACMNANEQNLVTADKYFDVEISGTWSSADTTAVTIHNYTTDATRYINIYTTGAARHQGVYSTNKYSLYHDFGSSSGTMISMQIPYTTLDGLQVSYNSTREFDDSTAILTFDGIAFLTIKNNIIFTTNGRTRNYGVNLNNSSGGTKTVYFYNNIIYGFKHTSGSVNISGISLGVGDFRTANYYVYNNTVFNCDRGVVASQGSTASTNNLSLKNNISTSNVVSDYSLGTVSTTNVNYNLSSDTTATGANSLVSKTAANQFVSITAGSEDFHLKAGADAIDAGTDLSGTFTTDIDGQTRTAPWDIGADEFVSSGPSTHTTMLRNAIFRNAIIR